MSQTAHASTTRTIRRIRVSAIVVGVCALLCAACGTKSERTAADKAEFHYELANSAFYEKNPMVAIQELNTALELDPLHKEAWHLLGFVYFGRDEFAEAQRDFERALQIDPRFFEARANLGSVLLAQQKWQMAIEVLSPLLDERLYPTPHLLHNNLGWAFLHLAEYDRAEEHLKSAVFLKPKMCLAHNNLGLLYARTGRGDLAVRALDRAISRCSDYQDPYFHLGQLYRSAAQEELATQSFQRCYELGPETPMGADCQAALGLKGGAP